MSSVEDRENIEDMDVSEFLKPGELVNSDHPEIVAFAKRLVGDATDDIDKAKRLYYGVRDEVHYDPYNVSLDIAGLGALGCLQEGSGFCVQKAALLAAAARAAGIPARVGYADVRNHLTSKRLNDMIKTDLFTYHGYTELYLEGKWVKATPVFHQSLCERARVVPLEFDGRNDSIFQPYNADGKKHMEYLHDHGPFFDVPMETIATAFRESYPALVSGEKIDGDFEADAAAFSDN